MVERSHRQLKNALASAPFLGPSGAPLCPKGGWCCLLSRAGLRHPPGPAGARRQPGDASTSHQEDPPLVRHTALVTPAAPHPTLVTEDMVYARCGSSPPPLPSAGARCKILHTTDGPQARVHHTGPPQAAPRHHSSSPSRESFCLAAKHCQPLLPHGHC